MSTLRMQDRQQGQQGQRPIDPIENLFNGLEEIRKGNIQQAAAKPVDPIENLYNGLEEIRNGKVHRILTPDGAVLVLPDTTNEAKPTAMGESPKNGSLATSKGSASIHIISESKENVNSDGRDISAGRPKRILTPKRLSSANVYYVTLKILLEITLTVVYN